MNSVEDKNQPLFKPFPNSRWFARPSDSKTLKKNKVEPCKRWGHSSVIVDDKLFIYGGAAYNANFPANETLFSLDLLTWNWNRLSALNDSPGVRDSHSCIAYQNKLYVFGGSVENESKNDLWEFDLTTALWKQIESKGDVPSPREGHSTYLFAGKFMVVYGGWDGSQIFNDCYLLDIPESTWVKVNNKNPEEPITREGHSFSLLRNNLYFFGGQGSTNTADNKSFDNYFNEFYKLTVFTNDQGPYFTWELVNTEGSKPTRRSAHSSCVYGDRYLFIIGGEGYSPDLNEETLTESDLLSLSEKKQTTEEYPCYPKNDVWYYDVEVNQWAKLKVTNELDFEARFAQTCSVYKNNLVFFGGLKDYDNCTNDINVLSLDGANPFRQQVRPEIPQADERAMEIEENKLAKTIYKPGVVKNDIIKENSIAGRKPDAMYETGKARNLTSRSHKSWPLVSPSFSHCLANMITWPLAAFGLFLDNAMIVKASNFRIRLVDGKKSSNVIKDEGPQEAAPPVAGEGGEAMVIEQPEKKEDKLDKVSQSIVIEDDGKGWKFNEFMNILMNYDTDAIDQDSEEHYHDIPALRINEYAFNLKAAGFRLGSTVIYISHTAEEVCLGYLTSTNDTVIKSQEPLVCVWEKGTKKFLTDETEKNKATILSKVEGLLTEQELFESPENCTNKIIILNLTQMTVPKPNNQKVKEPELVLSSVEGGNDILTKPINYEFTPSLSSEKVIEFSLRTYLKYFFLDPSVVSLKASINEDQINFVNLKELASKAPENQFIKVEDQSIFDGRIVFLNSQANGTTGQEATTENANGTKTEILDEENHNQGVLLYFRNRLIRRLENSKLGDFTFLSQHFQKPENAESKIRPVSNYYGYIQLSNFFKPNLFKMEIENPYFSNYVYSTVMYKMNEYNKAPTPAPILGKRERDLENEAGAEDGDQVEKKLKTD